MRNASDDISGSKSWKPQAEGQLREATDQVSHINLGVDTKSNTFAAAAAQYQADANDAERRCQASVVLMMNVKRRRTATGSNQ